MKEIACIRCGKKELFPDFMNAEKHLCDGCSREYMEALIADIAIEQEAELENIEQLHEGIF